MGKLSIKLLKGDFSLFSLAFFLQYFLFFLSKAFSYKLFFSLGLGLNKKYKNNTRQEKQWKYNVRIYIKACHGIEGKYIHFFHEC